jgi:hypothetical protein
MKKFLEQHVTHTPETLADGTLADASSALLVKAAIDRVKVALDRWLHVKAALDWWLHVKAAILFSVEDFVLR